ncbi:MAG: type II toxin-antitoxin system RelE/ParE family toxin [Clostridia bacterium]|nr:type II toxin-antitoxin system RelE/ParE family toxin [Clostridia bacterium]
MEYEVRITAQAQEQLREIRDYIANELFAPDAAQNSLRLLASAMASLAHMPGRVRLVDEEPWRSEGVRMKAIKNYLMYSSSCRKLASARCMISMNLLANSKKALPSLMAWARLFERSKLHSNIWIHSSGSSRSLTRASAAWDLFGSSMLRSISRS